MVIFATFAASLVDSRPTWRISGSLFKQPLENYKTYVLHLSSSFTYFYQKARRGDSVNEQKQLYVLFAIHVNSNPATLDGSTFRPHPLVSGASSGYHSQAPILES